MSECVCVCALDAAFLKKRLTPPLPLARNPQKQAKEALNHPYFDTGFDRAAVEGLENPELLVDE